MRGMEVHVPSGSTTRGYGLGGGEFCRLQRIGHPSHLWPCAQQHRWWLDWCGFLVSHVFFFHFFSPWFLHFFFTHVFFYIFFSMVFAFFFTHVFFFTFFSPWFLHFFLHMFFFFYIFFLHGFCIFFKPWFHIGHVFFWNSFAMSQKTIRFSMRTCIWWPTSCPS